MCLANAMMGFKLDRNLASRPPGTRLMHQNWCHLLFMHWRVNESLLRPLLPPELKIDQHDGDAWIGLIPFSMTGIRPAFGPALPGVSSFFQLNVRTYVTHHGEPGIWFFSLDASNPMVVWLARTVYHLPYFRASIEADQDNLRFSFQCERLGKACKGIGFRAKWQSGPPIGRIRPGSLAWFLTERYRLFTKTKGQIQTGEIRHEPWQLRSATLEEYESTLLSVVGLPEPSQHPVLYHSDELAVDFWPLRNTDRTKQSDSLFDPNGAVKPV
jgi:uncharacterized protein YqjF (DUF2071 family)